MDWKGGALRLATARAASTERLLETELAKLMHMEERACANASSAKTSRWR